MTVESPAGFQLGNTGYLLSRVGSAVQAGFKDRLGSWQLRPLHFLILISLSRAGNASQQELCRLTRIDSGNMVELIDTLERLGYAERRRDPADRRRYLVALTDAGRAAFAAMTTAVGDFTARFLEPLDQSEQAALAAALTKLYVTTPEGRSRPVDPVRPEPVRRR